MSIYTTDPTQQWRQKWELMLNGAGTKKYFHTWHNSENEAFAWSCNYIRKFGGNFPQSYYRPFGIPHLKPNSNHEPIATFIDHGVATLAPLT